MLSHFSSSLWQSVVLPAFMLAPATTTICGGLLALIGAPTPGQLPAVGQLKQDAKALADFILALRGCHVSRQIVSYNLVQDEASCVVFGMPKEAINAGAAHEVLPLGQIAGKLLEHLRRSGVASSNRL
jgi:hypothetical protein